MSFDFHAVYAGHSNVQLLAIVLQKELYDENAVQAAEEVLKNRVVTEEERKAAAAIVLEKARQEQKRSERKEVLAGRLYEIFYPFGKPITWRLKAFSIVCFLLWLFVFLLGPSFYNYTHGFFDYFDWPRLILLFSDVYFVVMLFLIYKINRNGWILAMIFYLLKSGVLIEELIATSALYRPEGNSYLLIRAAITGVILYAFNRKEVRNAFRVSKQEYLGVLISGCVLAVLAAIAQNR